MKTISMLILILISFSTSKAQEYDRDSFDLPHGKLEFTFINHASLLVKYKDKFIYVDPVKNGFNYREHPKADFILITHQHGDHFNAEVINSIKKDETTLIYTEVCKSINDLNGLVFKSGDKKTFSIMSVEAIEAYNILHKRENGQAYHPKGEGVGYILNFDGFSVYIAGDTENTMEMKALKNIDIAFLPMNLPYTMTPDMVADAAKAFKPKILYPYHFGKTDTSELLRLMSGFDQTEIRIKKWY